VTEVRAMGHSPKDEVGPGDVRHIASAIGELALYAKTEVLDAADEFLEAVLLLLDDERRRLPDKSQGLP
jgi:hypothetical protein